MKIRSGLLILGIQLDKDKLKTYFYMKFNFLKGKENQDDLKSEWNRIGEKYASDVNEMVEFGETNGWENWKGKEPEDKRDHLADEVYKLLKEANKNDKTEEFRNDFPPSHAPFIKYFEKIGQSIEHIHFIEKEKIVFLTGTAYQKRQAYILDGKKVIKLELSIDAIGKSKKNNVFAILSEGRIVTTQSWEGDIIETFELKETKGLGVTSIIPFNDGLKILLIASDGIFLITKNKEVMIHPEPDLEDEEWNSNIDMENGTISNDNQYIVVGDQCSQHRILDIDGNELGTIGPQSSYPHFCLFSNDDRQLITNSCHFYNGITIGVDSTKLNGIEIEEYQESDQYTTIDDGMRVYAGVAYDNVYILGDAYGYVRAINKQGKCIWRHFLGSTISGIDISADGKILWVGSCSGIIHKLILGKGHRDKHTIGNGNHYEEFRMILWKDEPIMIW